MIAVMAGETCAVALCMVKRLCGRLPHVSPVTVRAGIRRSKVRIWLSCDRLQAGVVSTVMAGEACARDKSMVHCCRGPSSRCVAILARFLRQDMKSAFALGISSVVAGQTGRDTGLCMIKLNNRSPDCCCVATLASIGS